MSHMTPGSCVQPAALLLKAGASASRHADAQANPLQDVSDTVTEQLFDVDLGNNLDVFLYEAARKMIRYGHVGVLVDAPAAGENGRPYWSIYSPPDVLGWRSEIIDGQQKLTQLRLFEKVVQPEGDYGEKLVEQVRVLYPGVHSRSGTKDKKGDYRVVEEGTTSLNDIPFAVAYANRTGILESRPPLADIAELNLKAYQVQSDLDKQLHISAVPMPPCMGSLSQPRSA